MNNHKLVFGLVLTISIFLSACSGAQSIKQSEVPTAVMKAFQEKFSQAKSVAWEKESETELEAEFKLNGDEMSANFAQDGTWLETESEIKQKDLPEAVKSTLKREFADYEVEECEKVATPEQAEAYELELEKGENTIEVVMDKNGTVLKQEIAEEDGR